MFRRAAVAQNVQQRTRDKTFPAPVRGLVLNKPLSAGKQDEALVLENFRVRQTTITPRAGLTRRATVGVGAVEAMFTYLSSAGDRLFAANSSKIFDVTGLDPAVAPLPSVTGQTSGAWSTVQFSTSGGAYLYAVNGADSAQLFDGTNWQAVTASSSPIAVTGVDTSDLSHVWVCKERLFFIQAETMTAWALPSGAVGGSAIEINLGGLFEKGGSLLLGGAWSIEDAGDGIDDKCVFVTDQGEVAVFEGDNPADPASWSLIGVYQIGRPLGKNATMRAGGDFLVATTEGIIPVVEAIRKDPAALSLASVTRAIEPLWRFEVDRSSQSGWNIIRWTDENVAYVTTTRTPGRVMVVNIETGAWSTYTGWDIRCGAVMNGKLYVAGIVPYIWEAEAGGSDDGVGFVARYSGAFSDLGEGRREKHMSLARAQFLGHAAFDHAVSFTFDYNTTFPGAPAASSAELPFPVWDTGLWDEATWDAGLNALESTLKPATHEWESVYGSGFVVAPQVQIALNGDFALDTELVGVDVIYDVGEVVV